jgi:hypothetical protein
VEPREVEMDFQEPGQLRIPDADNGLLQRFVAGDKAAERDIVRRMKNEPSWGETIADMSSTLRDQWIAFAAKQGFTREVVAARSRALARQLAGATPSALEMLLAERIVICDIALQRTEADYMRAIQEGFKPAKVVFYEHVMDRAHRRLLMAAKALAHVRRLQLPAVSQLNLATNQINVAAMNGSSIGEAPTEVD